MCGVPLCLVSAPDVGDIPYVRVFCAYARIIHKVTTSSQNVTEAPTPPQDGGQV